MWTSTHVVIVFNVNALLYGAWVSNKNNSYLLVNDLCLGSAKINAHYFSKWKFIITYFKSWRT